jgi:heme-degrading monooxygenase HmoA
LAKEVSDQRKGQKLVPQDQPRTVSGGVQKMHVQIVNFHLEGINEQGYRRLTESVASAFADLPGLVRKTWLADQETNTYGGVYVWRDRQAMEAYKKTDLFKGMLANLYFDDVTVRDFAALENPTRVTSGPPNEAVVSQASKPDRSKEMS